MALDVNTPKGQLTVAEEAACARVFERMRPGARYIKTPKDAPVRVDALLMQGDDIKAVVEQKSRFDVTLAEFKAPPPRGYGNEWLVTYDKLVVARRYAKEYSVPLYGFLWIVKDRVLLTQRITDRAGAWVAKFRVARTKTQATVNGGTAVRDNAFIDMTGAAEYRDVPALPAPAATPAPRPQRTTPPTAAQTIAEWLADYDTAGPREWGAQW